eukprot:TRINITY_DN19032_c0_g1_i4.p2 TRINITY_DN19032_c0_g1~~TRINITY_DN19032_c0_g1_i4.p2  ORF type:complete len:124 (-),score=33.12 TRINITY_DN19032_c0_g1_i4:112-483(-)
MIRRPPRSTQGVSSAASDVYKRQVSTQSTWGFKQMDRKDNIKYFFIGDVPSKGKIVDYYLDPKNKIFEEDYDKTIELIMTNENLEPNVRMTQNSAYGNWCIICLLYTSPSPRDLSTSRMPSSA